MAAVALLSTPAFAQNAGDSVVRAAGEPEEILVTSLRRTAKLQDVPAAVTVLGGDRLEQLGAKDYRDYLNNIPGVAYSEIGYRGARVVIRGISDGFAATSSLTGLYIDEAPVSETFVPTFDPSLYDVDRVEALKGPQGTLYGSGSMGGTIRVILKRPKLNTFEGNIEAGGGAVAHGDWNVSTNAMVNVPVVSDRVAVRVVGSYRRDGGFIDDAFHNTKDVNTIEKKNARLHVLLQPADKTTILLSFNHQEEEFGPPNYASPGFGPYQQSYVFTGYGNNDVNLSSALIEQDLGWSNLVSATNYLDKTSVQGIDATSLKRVVGLITGIASPASEGLAVLQRAGNRVFSQEIRLQSQGKQRLSWLLGGFFSDVSQSAYQTFDLSQAPSIAARTTGTNLYITDGHTTTQQFAGFGEATYAITDRISVTAGLRVFNVRQTADNSSSGLVNGGSTTTSRRTQNSDFTQKYLIDFKLTPENLLYAQAAQGFRIGQTNEVIPQVSCGADLRGAGYTNVPDAVGPDTLWNYELGSKNTFLNGRVTVNAAAYYIDWKDIQTSVALPCGFGFYVNSGSATSKGGEIEINARLAQGLTVGAAAALTHATLTEAAPGIPAKAGDPLALVPRWTANLALQYDFPLFDGLNGFAHAETNFVGKRWNNFRSVSALSRTMDPYALTNIRLGVMAEHWSASFFVSNLFDRRAAYYIAPNNPAYTVVGEPRVVGVRTKYEF